jgi:hypothetical protein
MSSNVPLASRSRNAEVIIRVRDGLRQIRGLHCILGEYVRLAESSEEDSYDKMKGNVEEFQDELYTQWDYVHN